MIAPKRPMDREALQRRARLQAVHRAARVRGLIDGSDDSAYRDVLERTVGVRSAKELSVPQLGKVLDAINGRTRVLTAESPAPSLGQEKQFAKITALLNASDKPWAYAEGIARRMFRKERLQFCTAEELRSVITALERDKQRGNRRQFNQCGNR